MADDSNEELKRLEDVLMRPDYVLEPKAYPTLRQYLTAGGTPQGVVMHLSDGYHGKAEPPCAWPQQKQANTHLTALVALITLPNLPQPLCQAFVAVRSALCVPLDRRVCAYGRADVPVADGLRRARSGRTQCVCALRP